MIEKNSDQRDSRKAERHLVALDLGASGELGLIVVGVLIAVAYILAVRPDTGLSLFEAAGFAFLAIPGAILALLICGRFFSRLSLVAGVILVFVSVSAVVVVSHYIQMQVTGGIENASSLLFRRFVFSNVLVAYLLRQSFLKHHLERRHESEQNAKIQALQSRIRPHFLFNSMNVIASLIPVDPDAAEQAVEDLSELFRASLQQAGTYARTSQELDLCRRYLAIEGLRMGDRLNVDWNVESPPAGAEMPLLMLQPLLENAIYHGIQPLSEGGTITVNVHFSSGVMEASIRNPLSTPENSAGGGDGGPGSPLLPHEGNNLAIANIRQRLDAVYGENATLITNQKYNEFEVTLICPTVPKMV